MKSKYEALEIWLDNKKNTSEISLSFKEIENIIGSSLPASAYKYQAWWANQTDTTNRPHARAWMSAEYMVDSVNIGIDRGSVSFVKK